MRKIVDYYFKTMIDVNELLKSLGISKEVKEGDTVSASDLAKEIKAEVTKGLVPKDTASSLPEVVKEVTEKAYAAINERLSNISEGLTVETLEDFGATHKQLIEKTGDSEKILADYKANLEKRYEKILKEKELKISELDGEISKNINQKKQSRVFTFATSQGVKDPSKFISQRVVSEIDDEYHVQVDATDDTPLLFNKKDPSLRALSEDGNPIIFDDVVKAKLSGYIPEAPTKQDYAKVAEAIDRKGIQATAATSHINVQDLLK